MSHAAEIADRSAAASAFVSWHVDGDSGLPQWAEGAGNYDDAMFDQFVMGLLIGLHHRDDAVLLVADFLSLDGPRALSALNAVNDWIINGPQPTDGPIALALQEFWEEEQDDDEGHDEDDEPPPPPSAPPTLQVRIRHRDEVPA